jgi:hypothetical protein
MISGIIYAVLAVIEGIIALRFIFRLLGANPASQFVDLIYDLSTPLVAPFAGIFGQDATVAGGVGVVTQGVFDWTALVALIVYGLILGAIGGFVGRRGRVV